MAHIESSVHFFLYQRLDRHQKVTDSPFQGVATEQKAKNRKRGYSYIPVQVFIRSYVFIREPKGASRSLGGYARPHDDRNIIFG